MGEPEPRQELEALVGGVRALLEQLSAAGTTELPSGMDAHRSAQAEARGPVEGRRLAEGRGSADARAHRQPTGSAPVATPAPPRAPLPAQPPTPSQTPARSGGGERPPIDREALAPEARRLRLAEVAAAAASCTRCALHQGRTRPVFARGDPRAELMFVGGGPDGDEDAQGRPFVGAPGAMLDRMISAMKFAVEDVYVTHAVLCRIPNRGLPDPRDVAACAGYLHEQIALVRPKVLVALGEVAAQALLGVRGIANLRGTWRLYRAEIPVMPTYSPAYLVTHLERKGDTWADLQQVMVRLGKPVAARTR